MASSRKQSHKEHLPLNRNEPSILINRYFPSAKLYSHRPYLSLQLRQMESDMKYPLFETPADTHDIAIVWDTCRVPWNDHCIRLPEKQMKNRPLFVTPTDSHEILTVWDTSGHMKRSLLETPVESQSETHTVTWNSHCTRHQDRRIVVTPEESTNNSHVPRHLESCLKDPSETPGKSCRTPAFGPSHCRNTHWKCPRLHSWDIRDLCVLLGSHHTWRVKDCCLLLDRQ